MGGVMPRERLAPPGSLRVRHHLYSVLWPLLAIGALVGPATTALSLSYTQVCQTRTTTRPLMV